jgi:MFS family permease
METPEPPSSPPVGTAGLWAPERRALVVGLALTVTLVAFEALAVATVMPEVKDELGGLSLYGWVFSGFFLGSLLGIVVAGDLADRYGVRLPYVAGLGLFVVGLLVGGSATSMEMLVAGRILQGFGAGAVPATAYTAVARGIPGDLRARMFAVMSTAWVVPGLVGPAAALAIAHALSWRWVFLVLVPITVVAAALTLPALRGLDRTREAGDDDAPSSSATGRTRLRQVAVLVVGVGLVFAAGSVGSVVLTVALVAIGLPAALWALLRLLPTGTLRLAPGVPATVAVRGLLTFTFFSADAYVPLAIVDGRGGPAWMAGAALTACTVLWTIGSWTQARLLDRVGPRRLAAAGFGVLLLTALGMLGVAQGLPTALAIPIWGLAGIGIGLTYAPLSVTVLAAARAGEEGAASASIQLSDGLGIALGTGAAGWLIAAADGRGAAVASGVTAVFVLSALMGLAGLLASRRLPRMLPRQEAPATAPAAVGH